MSFFKDKILKNKKIICIVSVLVLLFVVYICTALYFRNRFLPNTWIGDVYCTGRSTQAVAYDLKEKIVMPSIRISWGDESIEDSYIAPEDISYSYNLTSSVVKAVESQNILSWPVCLFTKQSLQLEPVISFDADLLRRQFSQLERVVAEAADNPEYSIRFDYETGYYVYDNHSHRLDTEKALQALNDSLISGKLSLTLDDSYYYDAPYTDDERSIITEWDNLSEFLTTDLVYDMGAEKIAFDSTVMSFLIVAERDHTPVKDDDGSYIIDDEAVAKWVDDLCSAYNTYGLDREFVSSTGKTVIIPATYSNYGTELNHDAELRFLNNYLHSEEPWDGTADEHIPDYNVEATVRGLNDIGDTFVEVDLTDQYMYYYKDGELVIETDIVSGDIPKGWTTPRGVFAIYGKYTDQYLYGKDYIDFVSYWMPYFRGYGLHDSDWRDEWGGDIYTYDGSHGCINMDKEPARIIFENIEIGTPVVVYDY